MAFKYLPLLVALVSTPLFAQNEGGGSSTDGSSGSFVVKLFPERQAERKQSRWTLGTWLKTKRQIEAQNRWLFNHSNKIPLEFAMGYTQSPTRVRGDLDIFVARMGLRASYGKRVGLLTDVDDLDHGPRDDTTQVAGALRLFGGNLQDSYLITRVGFEYTGFKNAGALVGGFGSWYAEPELQVYLAQWLGVRGNLRHRWAGSHMTRKTQKWGGRNYETMAFLEMGALRLEGGYRWQTWDMKDEGLLKNDEIVGAVRLFF